MFRSSLPTTRRDWPAWGLWPRCSRSTPRRTWTWPTPCGGGAAYAFRSLLERCTRLCFGSDAPVESPNPFRGLHAAVTRRRASGEPGPAGWQARQRLSLQQALDGYTTGAAYAAGWENWLGQLAPGFAADLIVLPVDPAALPVQELHTLAPAATMVAGRWVWRGA